MRTTNLTLAFTLILTACKVQAPNPSASTRLAPEPSTMSASCLAYQPEVLCDSRLIYNAEHDRYMIACRSELSEEEDPQSEVTEIASFITDMTTTLDYSFRVDDEDELDNARALHIGLPYTTDLLVVFDSVAGSNPEQLNPNRAQISDDQVVHWGSVVYIVGGIQTLKDLLGYNNPECQP